MATSTPDAITLDVPEEAPDAKMLGESNPPQDGDNPNGKNADEGSGFSIQSIFTILPLVLIGAAALFLFVPMPILGVLPGVAGGAVALVGSLFACGCIMRYGGMKYQLDRFKRENRRLAKTNDKLEKDVGQLEETNVQLGVQVDKLEGTVDELQVVSDNLQQDVAQFADVRKNLEDFAAKTGKDISAVIGDVNGVYDKIFELTVKNEKALLQRIAADIEFMDRDAAMSKQEFERFIARIPKHLQERFKTMGTSFEEIAGEDMMIDHHEMAGLIDKLLVENAGKAPGQS